jgi:uncharacterized protein with NRDE domain
MCLILFAWQPDRERELVVAANRDEHYGRPTAKAAFWVEAPDLLAGRDLEAGGTWLGITGGGRFAAITNFRAGGDKVNGAPSRGFLVSGFLSSDIDPLSYLRDLSAGADVYNGFNLVVGDRTTLCYFSNRGEDPRILEPGVYGLSNHLLDTDWPKVSRGKAALGDYLASPDEAGRQRLVGALADRDPAPDRALPNTGVGLAVERALSPLFIATADYGTRCTTVIERWGDGVSAFYERSFTRDGSFSDVSYEQITEAD